MDITHKVVNELLKDHNEFALVPYNPTPDKDLEFIFEHFKSLHKNVIYKAVLDKHFDHGDDSLAFAFNTIRHYKGDFDYFDISMEFDLYQKVKPWLGVKAKQRFREHFFTQYAQALLRDEVKELDDELINLILSRDIRLYMSIARKLQISDAIVKMYHTSPESVYEWINTSSNSYSELIKLNQPEFILKSMSGKLNATEGTLKYILEKVEPDIELYVSIKRKIGIKSLYNLTKQRVKPSFYVDLIQSLDDLIFVINIDSIDLDSIELVLNKTKERFPHIYDNLDSLLFVKKEFNNK